MLTETFKRRLRNDALALICFTALAAFQSSSHADDTAGSAAKPELTPSGTIEIEQTQVALLVSGSGGGGTLHFKGNTYPFSIGGLGLGGIGVSKIQATGTVYNMTDVSQFAGAYGQLRTGYALGDKGKGRLWLEKTNGNVVIHLNSTRQGLALSLGGDVVNIKLK